MGLFITTPEGFSNARFNKLDILYYSDIRWNFDSIELIYRNYEVLFNWKTMIELTKNNPLMDSDINIVFNIGPPNGWCHKYNL